MNTNKIFHIHMGFNAQEISEIKRTVSEEKTAMSKPPTSSDINETFELFNDFMIRVNEIPQFNTLSELYRWRKGIIAEKLNGVAV